jgi:Holliday junction resolvase RusA-like endonuclease
MTTVKFFAPGEPKGKGRPRFNPKGRPFTPDNTRAYEEEIRWAAQDAMKGRKPFAGAVVLSVCACYDCRLQPKNGHPLFKVSKPDLDNIVKLVLDGMNKIVFKDDAQVCIITATKAYGPEPEGLAIKVEELP